MIGRSTARGPGDAAPVQQARARVPLRAQLELMLWRHGLSWMVSAGLVVLAATLWWVGPRPQQQRLAAIEAQLRQAPAVPAVKPVVPAQDDVARQAEFRQTLQAYQDNPALVRRLVSLTRDELKWEQAEFSQTQDAALGLVRLQITVPVSGEYRMLRQAVARALLELPNVSVDQLLFRRQQVGQGVVEARVRLSMWLRLSAASGGGS